MTPPYMSCTPHGLPGLQRLCAELAGALCGVPCGRLVVSQQAPGGVPARPLGVHVHASAALAPGNRLQLLVGHLQCKTSISRLGRHETRPRTLESNTELQRRGKTSCRCMDIPEVRAASCGRAAAWPQHRSAPAPLPQPRAGRSAPSAWSWLCLASAGWPRCPARRTSQGEDTHAWRAQRWDASKVGIHALILQAVQLSLFPNLPHSYDHM